MSRRLYPHNRVRYWFAYDIDDVCALFSDFGLHPQTVRKWVKDGLPTIDTGKPTLIYGNDLIVWLKEKNQANKHKTGFGEFYCMSCQDARPIFQNRIVVIQKAQFLQVQGVCRECKSRMFKNHKLDEWALLRKKFKLVDVSQLYDCAHSIDKTHISTQDETAKNESLQWELFP